MNKHTIFTAFLLILLGVLTRTVFHVAPNFEFITAITLISATRFKQPYSILIPIASIVLSDLIIGNTIIYLFTWSGFIFTYILGWLSSKNLNSSKVFSKFVKYEGLALVGVLVFFFWTNLGVTLTTNIYPDTLEGYVQSLIMALPFLKVQVVSALLTAAGLVSVFEVIEKRFEQRKSKIAVI